MHPNRQNSEIYSRVCNSHLFRVGASSMTQANWDGNHVANLVLQKAKDYCGDFSDIGEFDAIARLAAINWDISPQQQELIGSLISTFNGKRDSLESVLKRSIAEKRVSPESLTDALFQVVQPLVNALHNNRADIERVIASLTNNSHFWIKTNITLLSLIASGVVDSVPYDNLYTKSRGYNFMTRKKPNSFMDVFLDFLERRADEFHRKTKKGEFSMLSFGPGTGRDEAAAAGKGIHVTMLEQSQHAVESLLPDTHSRLDAKAQERFHIPDAPTDLVSFMAENANNVRTENPTKKQWDAIYGGVSVLHYFPDDVMVQLFKDVFDSLAMNGVFAFSLKDIGVYFDTYGMLLTRRNDQYEDLPPDITEQMTGISRMTNHLLRSSFSRHEVLGLDRQRRFFRTRNELMRLLTLAIQGAPYSIAIERADTYTVRNYEVKGSEQDFHGVICRKIDTPRSRQKPPILGQAPLTPSRTVLIL